MFKNILMLLTLCLPGVALMAQPKDEFSAFGVNEGISLVNKDIGVVSKPGMVGIVAGAYSVLLYTVPKPIPQAVVYEAIYTEETGVCSVGAFIPEASELPALSKILNNKYGKSKFVGLSGMGGFNREIWTKDKYPQLPSNLFAIEILEGQYMGHIVPLLTYYYQNFPECIEILRNTAEDVL